MKSVVFMLCIFSISIASASPDTVGPNGINSSGLTGFNQQPLTGAGISIGQVEQTRPGKITTSGGPDDAAHSVTTTIPAGVFQQGGSASANTNIDDHAEGVADIMISTDANTIGVAPQASRCQNGRIHSRCIQQPDENSRYNKTGKYGRKLDIADSVRFIHCSNLPDFLQCANQFGERLTGLFIRRTA